MISLTKSRRDGRMNSFRVIDSSVFDERREGARVRPRSGRVARRPPEESSARRRRGGRRRGGTSVAQKTRVTKMRGSLLQALLSCPSVVVGSRARKQSAIIPGPVARVKTAGVSRDADTITCPGGGAHTRARVVVAASRHSRCLRLKQSRARRRARISSRPSTRCISSVRSPSAPRRASPFREIPNFPPSRRR